VRAEVARFVLLSAALLLGVPGFFVAARGLSGLRRGIAVVRGREMRGTAARVMSALLLVYGIAFVGVGVVLGVRAVR